MTAAELLRAYIRGWCAHDVEQVTATLADGCVITECQGATYRGVGAVERWMATWLADGSIDGWKLTSLLGTDDAAAAEWRFTCTWRGVSATFEGASIVRARDGYITYLREYETSYAPYDWDGVWRHEADGTE